MRSGPTLGSTLNRLSVLEILSLSFRPSPNSCIHSHLLALSQINLFKKEKEMNSSNFPHLGDDLPYTQHAGQACTPVTQEQHKLYHPKSFFWGSNLADGHLLPNASCLRRWTISYFQRWQAADFHDKWSLSPALPTDSCKGCQTGFCLFWPHCFL